MRLAPCGQWNNPVMQSLAAFAERVLVALVRPGDESVCGHRDVTPQLAHSRCSFRVRGVSVNGRAQPLKPAGPCSAGLHGDLPIQGAPCTADGGATVGKSFLLSDRDGSETLIAPPASRRERSQCSITPRCA